MTLDMDVSYIPLVSLDQPTETVIVLKLWEYNVLQLKIVFGNDHRWLAGIDLCHDPSNELVQHWIDCGAAKRFSEHYKILCTPDNFARNFGEPLFSF